MKALVTGGAGFIGSHITERLLNDGHEVVVLDDFSTGHRHNLPEHDKLSVVEGDIRNMQTVEDCMQGVNWVFHKAAVASVPKTVGDPVGSSAVNYQGTLHVLEAARKHNVDRVVFASSAALYGDEPTLPKQEDMMPVTLSPYAVDKLASEHACSMYTRLYGLQTVSLRYFNVYGPRQDPSSPYSGVISVFADRLSQQQMPTIFGDGEQTRDFVFVSDVVEANMKAVLRDEPVGRYMNIATGKSVSLNHLLKLFCELFQVACNPEYEKARAGDIKHSSASINRASKLLEWRPDVPLYEGLERLIKDVI